MKFIGALIATIAFSCLPAWAAVAEPQPDACDVPASFIESEIDLSHATDEMKDKHRLDITVLGTGSSALAGPDGVRFAYPARLEEALKQQLPGSEIKVTAHVAPKQTTANILGGLDKILAEDKPRFTEWAYWREEYVGLGPFRIREWVRGSYMVLEANERYALGRPRIDSIEVSCGR